MRLKTEFVLYIGRVFFIAIKIYRPINMHGSEFKVFLHSDEGGVGRLTYILSQSYTLLLNVQTRVSNIIFYFEC